MENNFWFNSKERFLLGCVFLILADLFWVFLSFLLKLEYEYEKPFHSTYFRGSLMTLYLLFAIVASLKKKKCGRPDNYIYLENEYDEPSCNKEIKCNLSTPVFVPVNTPEIVENCIVTDDATMRRAVRFSTFVEVRQMSESEASEALLARLSYQTSMKLNESTQATTNEVSVIEIAKMASFLCFLWFATHYFYLLALLKADTEWVNIFTSTAGLYTLLLTSIFPEPFDRITVTKIIVVLLNMFGIVLFIYPHINFDSSCPLMGACFAVLSAFTNSCFIVYFRRNLDFEKTLNIPLLLGFIGFYILVLFWPIFLFLQFSGFEKFELPSCYEVVWLTIKFFMATIFTETLWLMGCSLTSSLITCIAMSLTTPLSVFADIFMMKKTFSYLSFVGFISVLFSFLAIVLIYNRINSDPLKFLLRCAYSRIHRKTRFARFRFNERSTEQTEALINVNTDEHEV